MLVFVFGFPLLNRIVRLAKTEKITSIADFLGARYGKSFTVAAIATLIATIGAVPYIALQLKAISGSVSLMVEHYTGSPPSFDPFVSDISLVVAMLLALFAVLFGTRHADATEHQDGLVLAVAVETVVKLAAFLAIGLMVTFLIFGGPSDMFDKLAENDEVRQAMGYNTSLATWLVLPASAGLPSSCCRASSTSPSSRTAAKLNFAPRPGCFRSTLSRSTFSCCRLPSPACRWSGPGPAATSMCCHCRCSAAMMCWPWPPSSAACRRRPPWSSSKASRCRS
ncbi:hypothetical protein AJ88_16140 [Mesorhizobium amorphae CCBAU 01583]|nr:hypothetical protein AJ88_16140 [Mesorhizobium amorphae CCBAU 01583]